MLRSSNPRYDLPADVLLSAREISRNAPRPEPQAPDWLRRILPKSGLAGRMSDEELPRRRDFDDADDADPDSEDDSDMDWEGAASAALAPVTFDVRRGEGLGIVGTDGNATLTLRRILSRTLPPSDGMVLVRGRLVSLSKHDFNRYMGEVYGKKAVFLIARFLHWPRPLIRERWDEILEFAQLHELDKLSPGPRRNKTRHRLAYSAALHIDANVYVIDEGVPSDDEFGERVFQLLEQHKAEGAAIIQRAGSRVEEVARLCEQVLWISQGAEQFRGRPVEVAIEAEKTRKEELHPLSTPILASLTDTSDLARIEADGGTIAVDLEVLRKELLLALALELSDGHGHEAYLEQPDRFRSEAPGLHRLRIFLPGGLLPDGLYRARLLAEVAVAGSPPSPPREVLSFEVLMDGYEEAQADQQDVQFEFLLDPGDEEPGSEGEVEWNVGRATA